MYVSILNFILHCGINQIDYKQCIFAIAVNFQGFGNFCVFSHIGRHFDFEAS